MAATTTGQRDPHQGDLFEAHLKPFLYAPVIRESFEQIMANNRCNAQSRFRCITI